MSEDFERTPLFQLIVRPEIGAQVLEIPRGAEAYSQSSPAEDLYFVQRGQVRLYQVAPNGDKRLVEILGPGQWFGASALCDPQKYSIQAEAATNTRLSRVSVHTLMEQLPHHPAAAAQLIQQLACIARSAREDAASLVFHDCNQRLIEAMLRFSDSAAASVQGDDVVLHLTHEQLAQAVGAARETVSLALTEMRHRNLVHTGRNRLMFNRSTLRTAQHANGMAQQMA